MKKELYRSEIIFWILLAIPFIYAGYLWDRLPPTIITHFDISGKPDGWGSKAFILTAPCLNVSMYITFILIYISSGRMGGEAFERIFRNIRIILSVFFSALAFIVVRLALATGNIFSPLHVLRFALAVSMLIIAIVGYFTIDIKPNPFIGIRTKWTLNNEVVWKKTNSLLGRIFFYCGLFLFFATFFLPGIYLIIISPAFLILSVVFSIIYSRNEYKKLSRDKNAQV